MCSIRCVALVAVAAVLAPTSASAALFFNEVPLGDFSFVPARSLGAFPSNMPTTVSGFAGGDFEDSDAFDFTITTLSTVSVLVSRLDPRDDSVSATVHPGLNSFAPALGGGSIPAGVTAFPNLAPGDYTVRTSNGFDYDWRFTFTPVPDPTPMIPEPTSFAVWGLGSLIVASRRRRQA